MRLAEGGDALSEIGAPDAFVLHKILRHAIEDDASYLQKIGPVSDLERATGVLFHQQNRPAHFPQQRDNAQNLLDQQGRQPQRGFVQQQ